MEILLFKNLVKILKVFFLYIKKINFFQENINIFLIDTYTQNKNYNCAKTAIY